MHALTQMGGLHVCLPLKNASFLNTRLNGIHLYFCWIFAGCLIYRKMPNECSESSESEVFRELNDVKKTTWRAFGRSGNSAGEVAVEENLSRQTWEH